MRHRTTPFSHYPDGRDMAWLCRNRNRIHNAHYLRLTGCIG
jgi:hypothetical protein